MKDIKKPDFMTDEEWLKTRRRIWNEIQAKVDHPTHTQQMISKGIMLWFLGTAAFAIGCFLLYLGISCLKLIIS